MRFRLTEEDEGRDWLRRQSLPEGQRSVTHCDEGDERVQIEFPTKRVVSENCTERSGNGDIRDLRKNAPLSSNYQDIS